MRRLARALHSRRGMTLTETLMVVLIIALLTLVIATGIMAAFHVYIQSTFASASQMVSDTVDLALSDVLRYATDVETDGSGDVTAYTNSSYGVTDGKLHVGTDDDRGLIYLRYEGADSTENVLLLSDLSYSGLRVVPDDYDPDTGADSGAFDLRYIDGVFSGSYRLYDPVNSLLSDSFEFSFRTVNS